MESAAFFFSGVLGYSCKLVFSRDPLMRIDVGREIGILVQICVPGLKMRFLKYWATFFRGDVCYGIDVGFMEIFFARMGHSFFSYFRE